MPAADADAPTRSRPNAHARRLAATALVLAAVWWPARPGGQDGFPLSNYPMFARPRPARSTVATAVGITAAGERVALSPAQIGGTRQAKLAIATLGRAIETGAAPALCREIAAHLEPGAGQLVAVELATERWATLRALEPGARPLTRTRHARCEVGRGD